MGQEARARRVAAVAARLEPRLFDYSPAATASRDSSDLWPLGVMGGRALLAQLA